MDSFSSSLKVPLLVSLPIFTLVSVAATGRRTGRSTTPDKTNIPNTETNRKKMKIQKDKDFSVQEIVLQGQVPYQKTLYGAKLQIMSLTINLSIFVMVTKYVGF